MKSLNLSRPHLIVMVGIPGSGKSFFAENFAKTFAIPIVSYNLLKNEIPQSSVLSIKRVANYILDEILKTKQTIIYNSRTNSQIERNILTRKAQNLGYELLFIWVQTDLVTAKKRSTMQSSDNKLAINSEQFDNRLKQFHFPDRTENIVVISGKHTYSSQLKIVLKYLFSTNQIEVGVNKMVTDSEKANN